ncbi:MAG: hypothetical protein CMG00_08905 [Candidatus Marinimicrobia bacterium]|nr:hypothetical protein [Candidatus Neomarinimicrobiota bacterium]|tara:strand:+ start:16213 stop:18018 length:1806 start_codon:yes stop_codon:yes gene_type:complete
MAQKIKYINGIRFYRALVVGINNLISRQDYLNQINVFPVPDGDTGTNMAFTVSSILDGTSDFVPTKIGDMAQKVADCALDGARGNSGAILAQFFVGFSEILKNKDTMSTQDFANAFKNGSECAWEALSDPKEGTILSIFKDVSVFLLNLTSNEDDFSLVMMKCCVKAKESLKETPEKMSLLKKAGVVDAGAQGFVDFLDGINDFIQSGTLRELGEIISISSEIDKDHAENHDFSNLTYQFCSECLIEGNDIDKSTLKKRLEEIGDSIVIAGSNKKVKIHIHVNKPNELFQICNEYGITKKHKADDMFKQQKLVQSNKINKIALVTDSSADFNVNKYFDVFVIPVRYSFGRQDYIDKISQSADEFYTELKNNVNHPKTSQPTPGDFRRQYQFLNSYYSSIISIHIAEKLSGTFQSASIAAKNTSGTNISVIDSKTASVGLGLLIEHIAEKIEKSELNHEEALLNIDAAIKNIKIFSAVKDLNYAVKGGRVPKIVKTISNIFNFKPILYVKEDGSMGPCGIYTGKNKIPIKLFKFIKKRISSQSTYNILIGHSQSIEDGKKIKSLFEQSPNIFKKIQLIETGGALGVHTGPGAITVGVQKIDD